MPEAPLPVTVQHARHVLVETTNYAIEGFLFDDDHLIVTFDHAGRIGRRADSYRPGWGARPLRQRRQSHIAIKARTLCWYQHADLAQALDALHSDGFFDAFTRITTYGGSMGGFGALAYADYLGATRVVALNPQTTLHPDRTKWEKRWPDMRRADLWSGPFGDARGASRKAEEVLVFFDPHHRNDWRHVRRLDQDNVLRIHTPYLGHGLAATLQQVGALRPVLDTVCGAAFDVPAFHRALRRRRHLPDYFNRLGKRKRVARSRRFRKIVETHARRVPSDAS